MGEIVFRIGMGTDIYNAASRWLNRLSGSLGMSSVAACAIFSAMCGVSVAGAAAVGRFAIPEMLARGYHKSLATGCVASAGGLALLIPPSVALILYGVVADESVGKLFIGGIVPGVLLAVLMMSFIWILSKLRPDMAPPSTDVVTWPMRFRALVRVWPAMVLIFLVLGTIYLGIATPTEAAAVGCAGALAVGLQRRALSWKLLREIFRETIVTSGMIFVIFSAALLFGYVLTLLQLQQDLAQRVATAQLPNWMVLILIFALLYVMGMFLDVVSVILISTPILLPIVTGMGYNALWFGIVMAIACEIGTATPPVGLNLFVIKGVSPPSVSLGDIIRRCCRSPRSKLWGLLFLSRFREWSYGCRKCCNNGQTRSIGASTAFSAAPYRGGGLPLRQAFHEFAQDTLGHAPDDMVAVTEADHPSRFAAYRHARFLPPLRLPQQGQRHPKRIGHFRAGFDLHIGTDRGDKGSDDDASRTPGLRVVPRRDGPAIFRHARDRRRSPRASRAPPHLPGTRRSVRDDRRAKRRCRSTDRPRTRRAESSTSRVPQIVPGGESARPQPRAPPDPVPRVAYRFRCRGREPIVQCRDGRARKPDYALW